MALYFLVLDGAVFRDDIRPTLAASWRRRSFAPCAPLCVKLLPAARSFAERFHIGGETLLAQVPQGLPFDRLLWQHLAGELLWFSAREIPELQTDARALACLLAPSDDACETTPRTLLPPILQVHRGSRDLVFGGGFYRPEHAGWNDAADVARLATYLASVHPDTWQAEALAPMTDLPAEERAEELAYLRDWFGPLRELYAQAAARQQAIVCETLQ